MTMEFLAEYGLFLLKVMTIVVAIVIIITAVAAAGRKATQDGLEVENLNKKYRKTAAALRSAVMKKDERKKQAKEEKKQQKAEEKRASRPRSFIIDFKGDLKASAVSSLREEVSAVLDVATSGDEVIVRLENHGGIVHEHGLAASQLARIRDREMPLVVCVDKVAASGGYLMACVASKIYAAPFAILGSIGVLAQIPNFNRLLDSHGVDFEQ
ncbi:MAG: protease SohB, partial [Gammaproteobacteria bacterium]|nr:protease SohB [Gammaproteobacteria bacterium]